MNKTIIAVRGVSNSGKTTAIAYAYADLKAQFPCLYQGSRPRARVEVYGAILEIDGVKVGFASQGDKPPILEENLAPLMAAGCLVILCATHTLRSRTVDVVERLALGHGFEVVWIEKKQEKGGEAAQQRANRQTANEILAEVRNAVDRARHGEAA